MKRPAFRTADFEESDDECCSASSPRPPRYICTRRIGHPGEHVARLREDGADGADGELVDLDRWTP